MPTSEAPVNVNEPNEPQQEPRPPEESGAGGAVRGPVSSGSSRWVDYDTHELLQMISEMEDERRWARLREGFWIALLVHFALLSAVTWIPRYVFKVPPVIDPFTAIQQRKDMTYLNLPPDALKEIQPKPTVKPVPQKPVMIDKKTLDEINKMSPPKPEEAPPPPQKAEEQQKQPVAPPPIPPSQQSQSQIEAPKPAAVPARPNFAMNSMNPLDQLQRDMQAAAHNRGLGGEQSELERNRLRQHPGAGTGGLQILSDTQGVDFSAWLQRFVHETETTWDPLIPDEVNPPISKQGRVMIRFKVLPNGRLMDGSMVLEGRSGDSGLDRAAWGALTGSNYPPLPSQFHGPYLELRVFFLYNIDPNDQQQ